MLVEPRLRGLVIVSGLSQLFPGHAVGLGGSVVVRLVRQRDVLWELALVRRRMTCGKEVRNIVKKQSISLLSTT